MVEDVVEVANEGKEDFVETSPSRKWMESRTDSEQISAKENRFKIFVSTPTSTSKNSDSSRN